MNSSAKHPVSRFLSENQIKSNSLENCFVIYSLHASSKSNEMEIVDKDGDELGLKVVQQKNRNIVKSLNWF